MGSSVYDFKKLKEAIPTEYHFLLQNRLCDTATIKDEFRKKELHRAQFNKCERCGYDLLTPEAYRKTCRINQRHAYKGYVKYYDHHKQILCDKCVDELNGQPWQE